MKTRQTPKNVDSKGHYVRVELDTRDDVMVFALPLPGEASGHLRWQAHEQMGAQVDIEAAEAVGTEEASWDAREVMNQYLSGIQGYFLGMLWAHPTLELEAPSQEHPTMLEMGRAVVAEMYHAGWSLDEIQGLYHAALQVCIQRAYTNRFNDAKVARLVDFGVPTKEPAIAPTSEPGSPTTEIPEDSIA